MVKKVLLINGPNLNLLGTREPEKYGTTSLKDIENAAIAQAESKNDGSEVLVYQNNTEGFIIDRIHEAKVEGVGFVVINAGAYTHTSVGIRDALLGTAIPYIEVHITNVHQREPFRHQSYLSDKAVAVICGLGVYGYTASIEIADMDETITENVIAVNTQSISNPRLKFVLTKLIQHLHDFTRETRLTSEEWITGIQFLTECGAITSDIRSEFILLSDVLGVSILVDSISHPKPVSATPGTLLGPFHTHDAEIKQPGESISSAGKGEPVVITGFLTDIDGNPVADATIDLWHCDANGRYDTQYSDRTRPDMRGLVRTQSDGKFTIRATRPVSYSVPDDGPVGKLLHSIGRHAMRPAHIHFIIKKGDPYQDSDAVFGVKSQLLFELEKLGPRANEYGMDGEDWLLCWDFRIISGEQGHALRVQNNRSAIKGVDGVMLNEDGLPIASLD
ncbi:Catabolic 3-dehydroquinase [Spathaspora sp. JA1]|nr:Catabolic 3-dehydroquinase [Spathaspora sp. JA1]